MRKTLSILFVLLTLAFPVSVKAQYYSINVDYGTMEAMSEAFTTEAAMEALHNENLQKIYDSYKAAEVASAGIFSSKYLDRKALTNLNLWDDRQENYYYNRIYKIVSRRIIPKIVVCAQLMIEDPSTAIYWGSYLLKTCDDVKSLCQQFENIVTNSTLSFNDIAFLEISEELKAVFNLAKLGGIDWKELFEHLGDDIEGAFSEENLKADLDNLISKGVGLANAGYNNGVNQLLQGTSFGGTFMEKVGSVLTLADNVRNMYEEYKDLSATQVLTTVIGQENIGNLFSGQNTNNDVTGTLAASTQQEPSLIQRILTALIPFIDETDDIGLLLLGIHLPQAHARQFCAQESCSALLLSIHEISHGGRHAVAFCEHVAQQHLPHPVAEIDTRDNARRGVVFELLNGIAVLQFRICDVYWPQSGVHITDPDQSPRIRLRLTEGDSAVFELIAATAM